jgi:S-adenosylmethionine:tRNA ribosyltransferase-isomerase
MLIMNNTKVFPARISAFKPDGGMLEILLIRHMGDNAWEVLSRGNYSGRLRVSDELQVELLEGKNARLVCQGDLMEVIWKYGAMPLPPYIKRKPDESDKQTYQTVYARNEGSIAAPTAGLHFTDALLKEIRAKGIRVRELTLHVGIGTFRPVRAEHVEDHSMDTEHFEMDKQILSDIEETKASGRKIITVGTTTTRAIEGFASGRCVLTTLNGRLSGTTDMFIYPGYSFRVIDSLVTNFHLPGSTPLMLTSALCGRERLMQSYADAVTKGYRFLSYGDAMLIV